REPSVVEPELDELAGFGLELEPDSVALDRRVPALQRRETHGAVLVEVAAIADSDPGEVEELRGRGEHCGLVRRRGREVLLEPAAKTSEHSREVGEVSVLRSLALLAPLGVIDVLLAPLLVTARRLNVAARVDAEPDVGPSGRHGERGKTASDGSVPQRLTVLVEIDEASSASPASQSRLVAVHVA